MRKNISYNFNQILMRVKSSLKFQKDLNHHRLKVENRSTFSPLLTKDDFEDYETATNTIDHLSVLIIVLFIDASVKIVPSPPSHANKYY